MADDKGKIDEIELDMSLDDIEDLPEFRVFPKGAYLFTVQKHEKKDLEGTGDNDGKKFPVLQYDLAMKEIVELSESDLNKAEGEEAPKAGDMVSFTFRLDNKYGVGNLKKFLAPFAQSFKASKIAEVNDNIDGTECLVILGRKFDKNKDRYYQSMKKIAIP